MSKHNLTAIAIMVIAMLSSCDKDSYIEIPLVANSEPSEVIALNANILNGHEYVDLGLSVKWATCNVDAQ